MPEGEVLGGAFEGGGEAGAAEGSAGGLDPAAAAAAMEAARTDPALAAEAAAYFRKQSGLVDLQLRHFEEERRLATRTADIKRFGDRLRNGLQLFVILIGTAIALGLAGMAWDATQDHGLVVEAFSVPPDLAQQGRTGQVVAKQVLDRLSEMQAQTQTQRAAGSYSNNWGEALKVQIPETGVSLGELRQYLHVWLGHQTHITGEIYRSAGGTTVAVRAGEDGAKRFSGPETDLDGLVEQAAEHLYEATQPYRYAIFLRSAKRMAEARAVLTKLTQSPDRQERAWAYAGLGVQDQIEGDVPASIRRERDALREVPDFSPATAVLEGSSNLLGHEQAAADLATVYLRQVAKRNGYIAASEVVQMTADTRNGGDEFAGDYLAAARGDQALASSPGRLQSNGLSNLPVDLAWAHDLAAARSAAADLAATDSNRDFALGLAALETGDPAAVSLLAETRRIDESQPASRESSLTFDTPWLALAMARSGDLAGATALAATTPADCYLCVRMRGAIAELAGDRKAADHWYGEAIRQGPRLPQAYAERGAVRLARGDVAGALADAQAANKAGPHFADALKLWGDALARQGDGSGARAKYDEALKYAPAWVQLRTARAALR